MGSVSFDVPGLPKPAGSKRAFAHKSTGRIIVTDDSGVPGKQWRHCVADAARVAMHLAGFREPFRGPIRLLATFARPRPKSHYGAKGLKPNAPVYPLGKPDVTKLLRSVEDAMTGIVWADDAQVVIQHAYKEYGPPGVVVVVMELEGERCPPRSDSRP